MSFADSVPKHIQRIAAYKSENPAEELERDLGIKIVQLGMNENPFGPSPKAVEAARRLLESIAPYPDDSGYFLRQKLAADYNVSMEDSTGFTASRWAYNGKLFVLSEDGIRT
jgi:histidinol-phosphate/aromatic aminotransferase/cobyric acid decarboxylase-like protein